MRTLAIAAAAGFLTGFTPASAQMLISPPVARTAPDRQRLYDPTQFRAPVARSQPPVAEIRPQDPNPGDPITDLAREDADLSRRISGICRGC